MINFIIRIAKDVKYYLWFVTTRFFEFFRLFSYRKKIKNTNFTIISNNCIGGVIYHLLGLKFLSPTINLYFEMDDYLKFLSNLKFYISQKLLEVESEKPFPVGELYDIRIYFMHYKSFDEASHKWNERAKRINWDNLIVILAERALPLSEQQVKNFDNLPYEKKVCFYTRPIEGCSSVYVQEINTKRDYQIATSYSGWLGKRNFMDNDFDFVRFINEGQYWMKS